LRGKKQDDPKPLREILEDSMVDFACGLSNDTKMQNEILSVEKGQTRHVDLDDDPLLSSILLKFVG
jgi:hypothetical protein